MAMKPLSFHNEGNHFIVGKFAPGGIKGNQISSLYYAGLVFSVSSTSNNEQTCIIQATSTTLKSLS